MDPAAKYRRHDEDTAMRNHIYHILDTLFGLFAFNLLHYLSSVHLKKCGKIVCAQTRTNGFPFLFRTMPDSVVSTIRIEQPSAPAHKHPMNVDDMNSVELQPSIALPLLFSRNSKEKVLTRLIKNLPVSKSFSVNKNFKQIQISLKHHYS